jgi:adenylate cyclase
MQWLSRHRLIALGGICIFWTGLILLGPFSSQVPFLYSPWSGEQNFEDILRREGRRTPERQDFVFVGLDEASLQMCQPQDRNLDPEQIAGNRGLELMAERPWPWSREIWALFLDKVFAAGARLVMFDMIFNAPNDGDEAFHTALEKYRDRVVVGCNFDLSQNNAPLTLPNSTLIPAPQYLDDRVGYVNFFPDPDGRVRAARFHYSQSLWSGYQLSSGDETFTSFAGRALTKLGFEKDVPTDFGQHAIRFGPDGAYAPREVWQIFFPKSW